MTASRRRNIIVLAFLVVALSLVLVFGCRSGTHTRAGEKWDTYDEEVTQTTGTTETVETVDTVESPTTPEVEDVRESVAVVPASPSDLKGEHVEDVCYRLIKAGFTNIEPREDADLRVAVLHDEGDVSKVTIEGSKRFHKGDEYPADARVVVEYHTYRNKKKREISIEELKKRITTWLSESHAESSTDTSGE